MCPGATSSPRSSFATTGRWSVFPIDPIHRVCFEVTADGGTKGREEQLFTDLSEESESLELVLDRIFELCPAQFGPGILQRFMQFDQGIGCGDVHAGHRLRRNDHPA